MSYCGRWNYSFVLFHTSHGYPYMVNKAFIDEIVFLRCMPSLKNLRDPTYLHTDRSNTFNSCYVILYSKCFQIQQVVLLASFIICCIRGVTQAQQSADLNFMGRIVWPPHSHIFKGPMNLSFCHFLFKIADFILFFYSSLLAIGNRFKASALAFYTDNMPLFPTNF